MARARKPAIESSCSGVILLVDDDPDTRDLEALLLRSSGYRVLEASDGVEALAVLRRLRPDLILLDLAMPHMNGREFLQRLRTRPDAEVPVCVISAERCDPSLGASASIRKPFSAASLLALVERLCRPV